MKQSKNRTSVLCFTLLQSPIILGSEVCYNNFNGYNTTTNCTGSEYCCRNGESYAINLDESEVCSYEESCANITNLPTSCLISVDGVESMYGCGTGAYCCHEQGREFFYRSVQWEDVCGTPGSGCGPVFEVDWDVEREVQCYDECATISKMTVDGISYLAFLEADDLECSKDYVNKCGSYEVCLSTSTQLMFDSPNDLGGTSEYLMTFNYRSCEDAVVVSDQDFYCNELVNGITEGLETEGMTLSDVKSYCAFQDVCTDDSCVRESDRIGNFPAWAIVLIVLLIVAVIVIIVVIACCACRDKGQVQPDPTPVPMEEIIVQQEDPRTRRIRELEALLTAAINARDMADLQLATDAVEEEHMEGEMREKYDKACALLGQLLARDAETKRKELEEAEREAAEAKRKMEEAEAEVERRRKAEEEAARIREAELLAEEARKRWARIWPRVQVLRALNAVDADAKAKAMEAARRAREEEERQKREEEERRERAMACKKMLRGAINANTIEKLENAIKHTERETFQTTLMEHDDELKRLYAEAREALDKLRKEEEEKRLAEERRLEEERRIGEEKRQAALARLGEIEIILKRGISDRNIDLLKSGIKQADDNYLQKDLFPDYDNAKVLLERLEKIEKVKKNIMELKRPLIAELKSMANPPVPVQKAMTGAFLLMGEKASYLREWNNIVILLNKTGQLSVKRRVQELQMDRVTDEIAKSAEDTMFGLSSDEVYEANQAASLFYDWADMICYEYKQLKSGK
eukprot:sb/3462368/